MSEICFLYLQEPAKPKPKVVKKTTERLKQRKKAVVDPSIEEDSNDHDTSVLSASGKYYNSLLICFKVVDTSVSPW